MDQLHPTQSKLASVTGLDRVPPYMASSYIRGYDRTGSLSMRGWIPLELICGCMLYDCHILGIKSETLYLFYTSC